MADALNLNGQVTVLHKGPMTSDAITEYEAPLEDYVPDGEQHIICDRWDVGELVYGPILRGKVRTSEAERRHIDMFLAKRGAIVVIAHAPQDLVAERLQTRGDDLVDVSMLQAIIDGYAMTWAGQAWHRPCYDAILVGDDDQDADTIRDMLTVAYQAELLAAGLHEFTTYVGPVRPAYLLLGERRNERMGQGMRSAFVPKSGTSGAYLLDAIPVDVFKRMGLANACEEDLTRLWPALGEPYVVALGREAKQRCLEAEILHGAVPHPQYIRRFHNARQAEYGSAIREALLHRKDMTGVFAPT